MGALVVLAAVLIGVLLGVILTVVLIVVRGVTEIGAAFEHAGWLPSEKEVRR